MSTTELEIDDRGGWGDAGAAALWINPLVARRREASSVAGYEEGVDVESAVLIGLLATALFATIGLLATALFQLRGRIDQLRDEVAGIRADLARIEARLDAHLQESPG